MNRIRNRSGRYGTQARGRGRYRQGSGPTHDRTVLPTRLETSKTAEPSPSRLRRFPRASGSRYETYSSRSFDFWTLPVAPRGSSWTKTTSSGSHHLATLSRM